MFEMCAKAATAFNGTAWLSGGLEVASVGITRMELLRKSHNPDEKLT